MKSRDYIDFHAVKPEHSEMHERLNNWARWVRNSQSSWTAHPMWRHLKEKEALERRAIRSIPVDSLDGHLMERAVAALPEKHKKAIRWSYVFRGNPMGAARSLAVTKDRLAELVNDGRSMLVNRTRVLVKSA